MDDTELFNYWSSLSDKDKYKIRWRFFGDQSPIDLQYAPKKSLDCIPILDHGYVALLDHMGTDIDIVNAARKSFNRKSEFFDESDEKLLRYLWKNRHTSPFEMVEFKFAVMAPIFVARQWMRHRTWSYNEISRRYTDDNLNFYNPDIEYMRKQSKSDRQSSVEWESDNRNKIDCRSIMNANTKKCVEQYWNLISNGMCREQARMVLPQSLYTEFVAKVNLSNLLHFLKLRLDNHAQWEIQQYSEAIVEMLKTVVPKTINIFEEELNENSRKNS